MSDSESFIVTKISQRINKLVTKFIISDIIMIILDYILEELTYNKNVNIENFGGFFLRWKKNMYKTPGRGILTFRPDNNFKQLIMDRARFIMLSLDKRKRTWATKKNSMMT